MHKMSAVADTRNGTWIAMLTYFMETPVFTCLIKGGAILCQAIQGRIFEGHIEDPSAGAALRILLAIVTRVTRIIEGRPPVQTCVEVLRLGLKEDEWPDAGFFLQQARKLAVGFVRITS